MTRQSKRWRERVLLVALLLAACQDITTHHTKTREASPILGKLLVAPPHPVKPDPLYPFVDGQMPFPAQMIPGRMTFALERTGGCPTIEFPSSVARDGSWVVGLVSYGDYADCLHEKLVARRRRSRDILIEIDISGDRLSSLIDDPTPLQAYAGRKVGEMNAFLEGKDLIALEPCANLTPPIDVSYSKKTVEVRRGGKPLFSQYRPDWLEPVVPPRCRTILHASVYAFCDLQSGLIIADVDFSGGGCKHPIPRLEVVEAPALRGP